MPEPSPRGRLDAFGADPRSLALFRVALALLLLADLAMRARDLRLLYTDDGVLPRSVVAQTGRGAIYASLHLLGGSAAWVSALFLLAGAAALALLVGWRTRIATVASWALLLSLHNRNPFVQNGGDHLLRMLLFWGMFLPLERCASVDRVGEPPDDRLRPVVSMGWAGLAIQSCAVYLSCAIFKGPLWREGTAVYYLLRTDYFTLSAGTALLEWPRLLRLLTWASYGLEWSVAFLLLAPLVGGRTRILGVALLAAMHLGFLSCLRIGLFPLISIASVLPFLPALFWDGLRGPRAEAVARRLDALLGALARRLPRTATFALPAWAPRLREQVAAVFVGYILLLNVWAHLGSRKTGPPLGWLMEGLRLDQPWSMFQGPKRVTGWHVFPAQTGAGRTLDLIRKGAPVDYGPPPVVRDLYPTEHSFRYTYHLNTPRKRRGAQYARYADQLCRTWNATHDGPARIVSVDLVWVFAETLPAGATGPARKDVIWRQTCGGPGEPGGTAGGTPGDAPELP